MEEFYKTMKLNSIKNQNTEHLKDRLNLLDKAFQQFWSIIPNPDQKIRTKGIKIYERTLADPVVTGCADTIIQSVNALEFEIIQNDADSKEVELAKIILTNLFENDLIENLILGVLFGNMYLDLIWDYYDNKLVPISHSALPHSSFIYRPDKETKEIKLYVLTEDNPTYGEEVPKFKLLVPTFKASSDNPYGKGLLSNCYKSVFIKENALDFWAIFVEDHGTPKVEAQISDQLRNYMKDELQMDHHEILSSILADIQNLKQNGAFAHYEGLEVKSLASGSSNNGITHKDLMDFCDKQIAILLLGHNGSSQSTPGKLGSEDVAMFALNSRIMSYAAFVADYCNVLLKWIHEINYGLGKAPQIRFYEKDDVSMYKSKAEYLQILTNMGVKFNDDFYSDHFNLDKKYFTVSEPVKDDPPTVQQPIDDKKVDEKKKVQKQQSLQHLLSNNFAENSAKEEMDLLKEFGDYVVEHKEMKSAIDDISNSLIKFIKKHNSYDELLDSLYDYYPNVSTGKLQKLLSKILLIARTYGNIQED